MSRWKKLFCEESVLRLVTFDKEITILVLGKEVKFKIMKTVSVFLSAFILISFLIVLKLMIPFIYDLRITVIFLNVIIKITFNLARTHASFFGPDYARIYQRVTELDLKQNQSSKESFDITSVGLMGLFTVSNLRLLLMPLIVMQNPLLFISLGISDVLYCYNMMKVSIMKYQIAKRLRMVISEEEPVDQVEQLMDNTRELLEYNTQMNTSTEPLVTAALMYSFTKSINNNFYLWIAHGLGDDVFITYEHFPVIATLAGSGYFGLDIFLAYISSNVAVEIDQIKMELDICLTARGVSENVAERITMYLLELAHTPVVINGLGLFHITCSSLITAWGLIIAYLLVLIQFS